ncbi:O-fucosyltransferase 11 [Linum grandiflorum]
MAINTATKAKSHNVGSDGDNNSNNSSSTSPPPSPSPPPPPPPLRHIGRRRSRSSKFRKENGSTTTAFLRWNFRYLLFLPLLYISGLIMCVGPFSTALIALGRVAVPGASYRSHELFQRLWPDIVADNSTAIQLSSVWKYKRRFKVQKPCSNSSFSVMRRPFPSFSESSGPSGYLLINANGGLNQQRSAICNAVAVAGLLNAVLVIPKFDFNRVWKDPSEFEDIYDQDHFIATLEKHVKVVKELPEEMMRKYDYNLTNIQSIRVPPWAPANYYLGQIYPVLREHGVLRFAPFANRLAMSVPPNIQLLRCLTNYKALRYAPPILTLAEKLVNRMIEKSSVNGGKYVSIHLRFEQDMVAFSCCIYDGGAAERKELASYRESEWKEKFKRTDRDVNPGLNRIEGKCPLTPLEVGMILRGMGFDNSTSIYIASGKIYQAERHLKPLLKMFPLLYFKESLATPEELAPFEGHSSRLAALDYTVSLYSEVFMTTQGGNFPHFLMGHRRFLFNGHAKTIKPDKRKLVLLLQDKTISWNAFKDQMQEVLAESDRKGLMVPRVKKINRKTSIYQYPLPECSCLQPQNSSLRLNHDHTDSLGSHPKFSR